MTKYKILVVDDEESLCEILQFNLEVEGYEVDVAYSAEQALDMHPERYSLILDVYKRQVRDNARKTHRTGIHTVLMVVVIPQHLARDLTDAVDGRGLHDRVLWGLVLGGRGPEGADRTGREEGAMVLARHLERIVERPHIDVPGHLRITFAHSREQSDQVEDRIDVVTRHDRRHRRRIERIEHFERAGLAEGLAFAHVGSHDIVVTVNFAQIDCQLGTNLASGTYY